MKNIKGFYEQLFDIQNLRNINLIYNNLKQFLDAPSTGLERNEKIVLRAHLIDDKTFKEIGDDLKLSTSRIKQIYNASLGSLGSSGAIDKILVGVRTTDLEKAYQMKVQELHLAIGEVEKQISILRNMVGEASEYLKTKNIVVELGTNEVMQKQNISVLNLSVRTYNCLRRSRIETVADVLKLGTKEMMEIRNLGLKSAYELLKKLNIESFISDEEYDARIKAIEDYRKGLYRKH